VTVEIVNRNRAMRVDLSLLKRVASRAVELESQGAIGGREGKSVAENDVGAIANRDRVRGGREYNSLPQGLSPARFLNALEISLVDDAAIARVNEEFLGHAGATDVISFLYESDRRGELIISTERAAAQSKEWGNTVAREIALYVVHGILHLNGYTDTTAPQKKRMRRREKELMSLLAQEFDLEKILKIKGRAGR
jgi:probable rRNA maturation factor